MNERYDVDRTGREDGGGGGTGLDVAGLLEEASWTGQREVLDPDEHWLSGRRRRSRKRAGAGVLGGVTLAAVAGLVWQAGVFGGEVGPLEPHVATLPSGLTTFVLAAPGADATGVEEDGAELEVADAKELAGTSWELTDQVWGSDEGAPEIVGSDAETVFSFAGPDSRGWGFAADDCGGGWFQEDLRLTADGSFPGRDLATRDQGCPEPAQTAEDFWMDVLAHGGALHTLDDDWLLLSVDTMQAGVEQPPTVVVADATRLVFVLDGTDPDGTDQDGADLDGAERVPSNEDLAGSRWQLVGDGSGAGALQPWLEDPSQLQLWFEDSWPASVGLPVALDYGEGCLLAQLQTEGVDARGVAVPTEGLSAPVRTGTEPCSGAEEAGPVLVDALEGGVQVTLVGEDTLLLRITLPAGDGVAQTQTPAAPTAPGDGTGTPTPGESPTPAPTTEPTGPTAAPTTPSTPTAPAPTSPAPTSPVPTSPTSPTAPTSPAPTTPDDGPAFMAPDEQWVGQPWPASGGGIYAPSVRAGAHDGFDRIVLDLTGQPGATGPGWYAVYTPNPLRDGSGLPMQIAGDSVLEIVLNSMAYPEPGDPVYDDGDFGLDTHRLGAVEEVIRTTPWEGQIQLFVGMRGEPRPYRVFLLQDPMRLVVDVQNAG